MEAQEREALVKKLRWHQSQLHHFINLYFDKDRFTDSEREYYKKYTDNTYRKHLAIVAKLQEELNQFDSEAIL